MADKIGTDEYGEILIYQTDDEGKYLYIRLMMKGYKIFRKGLVSSGS